jgi:hypothetical protein
LVLKRIYTLFLTFITLSIPLLKLPISITRNMAISCGQITLGNGLKRSSKDKLSLLTISNKAANTGTRKGESILTKRKRPWQLKISKLSSPMPK